MAKTATSTALPLPSLIRASSWDAGNFSMRAAGRSVWSEEDADAASECQERLVRACYGAASDKDDRLCFIRFGFAEQLQKQGILHIGMTHKQLLTAFNEAVRAAS